MKRGLEEIKDETSPASLTKRLACGEISTANNINIPLDLTVEILKKLPTKSLVRFQCVSKQWSSTIGSRRDFIDSIVARSLTEPRRDTHLIFLHCSDKILKSDFFTFCPTYPRNTDNGSVSILSDLCQYVRGLFIFWSYDDPEVAIYNPTTRQSLSLPKINFPAGAVSFLGYDPFKNQYKVIFLRKNIVRSCHVFTLGDPTRKWREIQCDIGLHFPLVGPVCINGTIYYRATIPNGRSYTYVLMSFDVMSEKFDQVETPKTLMDHWSTLINYRGKLGLIMCLQKGVEIWVMEDARKEWSKIIFNEMVGLEKWRIAGATRFGEIVFLNRLLVWQQTLHVYYYDPKRNSLRCVEVEGTKIRDTDYGRKHRLYIWLACSRSCREYDAFIAYNT